MRIPNKFNGYSADNRRLYNDPATLTALTAAGAEGSMAGAALGTAATAAAPVATGAALGILPEATGILPETLGGAQGIMQSAAPAVDASTKALATQASLPGAGSPPSIEEMQAMGQKFAANSPGAGNPDMAQQLTAGDNIAPNQINPTPGTQPGSLPNVPTQPNPAYANPAYDASAKAAAAQMPATVGGPESTGGIMNQLKDFIDPLTKGFDTATEYAKKNPITAAAGLYGLSKITERKPSGGGEKSTGSSFNYNAFNAPTMNPLLYGADGGLMQSYAEGGMTPGITSGAPVERMSRQNAVGANTGYPMANQPAFGYGAYASAPQNPLSQNMLQPEGAQQKLDPYTGEPKFSDGGSTDPMTRFRKQLAKQEEEQKAEGEALYQHGRSKVENRGIVPTPLAEASSDPYTGAMNRMKKAYQVAGIKMHEMPKVNMPESFNVTEAAGGGIMHGDLGGYSDGGRLLKGPGDGVSDSIPAVIGNKQPARLADGEFVVPARIVSELGNGSTEAGARKLYAMMERIQKGRRKSVGKGKVAVNSKADKHLPA